MTRILSAACIVLLGCSDRSAQQQSAATKPPPVSSPSNPVHVAGIEPPTKDSILSQFSAYGDSFGDSRAGIVARLGPAMRTTVRATIAHPSAPLSRADSFFVLEYPNAYFEVGYVADGAFDMLFTIRVWGSPRGLPLAVKPGATTAAQLSTLLGPADYRSPPAVDTTFVTYQGRGELTDLITFGLVGDTVRVIVWRFRMG